MTKQVTLPSLLLNLSAMVIAGIANASTETEPKWNTFTTTYACQYVHSSAVRKKDGKYRTETFRLEDPFFYQVSPHLSEP